MATQIRQPQIPPTAATAATNSARVLPQNTEERLAALRAAREKRKNDPVVGAFPTTPGASSSPTPTMTSPTNSSMNPPAPGGGGGGGAAAGVRPAIGSRLNPGGPPVATNSLQVPSQSNPTPLSASLSVGPSAASAANRSPSVNGQTSLTQSATGRNLPSRVSNAPPSAFSNMSRRPSQVVIDKEKKNRLLERCGTYSGGTGIESFRR